MAPQNRGGSHAQPVVSVIVNNYNYATYLASAVESALGQDYSQTEILVVDDGSTDHSREIIAAYGSRVTAIYKSNGGQASALNAGFAASRGDVILFLDADDLLFASSVTEIVTAFSEGGIANVHWPMWIVDAAGNRSGGTKPPHPPAEGDFREQLLARGPSNVPYSPTSGNAWRRSFLERVCPIPEDVPYYRLCADEYLYTLVPAFGRIRTIAEPLGCYRIHGRNVYSGRSFRDKLDLELAGYDQQCRALKVTLARNDISIDVHQWKQHSWFHRLDRAVSEILCVVPEQASLVLVEGATWDAADAFGRRAVRPFLCRDGIDGGPPADCDAAITQLAATCEEGAEYLAIAWPSYWWFETYPKFFVHLGQVAECIHKDDDITIFKLASGGGHRHGRISSLGQREEAHSHA